MERPGPIIINLNEVIMEQKKNQKENSILETQIEKYDKEYKESLKKDEEFSVLKKYREKIKTLNKLLRKKNREN